MLYFSQSGIQELQTLANQAMPFLRSDDAEILWTVCSGISLSRGVSSADYQRIISIIQRYVLCPGLKDAKNSCAANMSAQHNCEHGSEHSGEEEPFLMFRYFLLSYSGIERFERREMYPVQEQDQILEAQVGG